MPAISPDQRSSLSRLSHQVVEMPALLVPLLRADAMLPRWVVPSGVMAAARAMEAADTPAGGGRGSAELTGALDCAVLRALSCPES